MIAIKIGIIDSGLGAISFLNYLISNKKYSTYYLLLDYNFNPYGNKNENILYERLIKNIDFLKKKGCNKIVLACNTLSVIALKHNIDVITPINYFIETIKKEFDNNSILIATNFTIKSNVYKTNNSLYSDLVNYIEGVKPININSEINKLKKYKKIFFGCTHYGLIKNKLKDNMIFDSAKILADSLIVNNTNLNVNIYITKYDINIINHLLNNIHIKKFSIKRIKYNN